VLGGGGARGAAQVGVLQALFEANIEAPSAVVGTSVGALNGASIAAYPSLAGTMMLREVWMSRPALTVFQAHPLGLLVSGIRRDQLSAFPQQNVRRLIDRAQALTGVTTFEQLRVPLAVVATDLSAGKPVVFRSGLLTPALLASTAIPGLFPSVRIDGRERRVLLRSAEETVDPGGSFGWVLGNAGASGFYRTAYDDELLRRLIRALPELRPEERMALVSDQWALVRANAAKLEGFVDLLAALETEEDHSVLDEVVGRLSYLEHRVVSEASRGALHSFVGRLFQRAAADLGWDPRAGESDERRLRRSAVQRALALVARDPAAVADATARYQRHVARHPHAVDPNLLDVVVAAAARTADEKRFDELRELARTELDPAAKRRYLHALAMQFPIAPLA